MNKQIEYTSDYHQISFDNTQDFFEFINPNNSFWNNEQHVWGFRGQADSEWSLQPTLLREDRFKGFLFQHQRQTYGENRDISIIAAECQMISLFIQEVDKSGLKIPSHPNPSNREEYYELVHSLEPNNPLGKKNKNEREAIYLQLPPIQYWESFALAQHYGAPTRLLDWSWSAYTSAYFASLGACKRKSEKFAIYCLQSNLINNIKDNISIINVPRVDNPNLKAQQGFFSIDHFAFQKDYCFSTEIKNILSSELTGIIQFIKIELNGALAPKMLRELYQLGYSAKFLFPGYSGIVEGMREIKFWDDPYLSYTEEGWWNY